MSLVVAARLEKSYRAGEVDVPAIRGLDFTIEAGTFVNFAVRRRGRVDAVREDAPPKLASITHEIVVDTDEPDGWRCCTAT